MSDTENEFNVTISPMGPLATEANPTVLASCDVITLTPLETLVVAPPIVRPVSVTVAAVDAATVPLRTVNTTELAVCDVQLAVPPPLMVTVGEGEDRKKLAGQLRVMVPPVGTSPPTLLGPVALIDLFDTGVLLLHDFD